MARGGEEEGRPPEQAASPPEASQGGGSGRPLPPAPPPARLPRLGLALAFLAALLAAKYYRDAEAARRQVMRNRVVVVVVGPCGGKLCGLGTLKGTETDNSNNHDYVHEMETALKSLGNEGLFLFSSLDTNNDLFISPEEFKPIAEKLTGMVPVSGTEEEEVTDPNGETLSILAKFQPLIHAEFQLNEPPDFPFWFSPAQFTGYIVFSKDSSHVREFKLFVPNNRSLNVDMEWLYGALESSNMEVDIGYLPQMELESLGPSTPSVIHDENGNVIDSREGEPIQFIFEDISWQREISWEEASGKLEVVMYPFKKAFEKAKSEGSGRTLRETVLESSPILAFLNESFISTWSLVKELEDLQDKQDEITSKLADLHLEKYNFPVEIMICLPNGTVVHHINANYFLDITSMKPEEVESSIFSFSSSFEDPSTATYLQFLKEGLQKAKSYL
ncbi:hypothetical protein E2320_000401 [Naja naja]|nr:hypothetical protein E2320_000401 [Naja naja]